MQNHTHTVAAALAVPVAFAFLAGCAQGEQAADETTSPTTSPAPSGDTLSTELQTADGRSVANVDIEFVDDYATITLETTEAGILTPGFHAFHIHAVGLCEPNSVAPGGGEPGDFLSAGGHLHGPDNHAAIGDLTPIDVRSDGSARLVATTDSFTIDDLRGPQGSALMIHEGPDNFANIPPRYTSNGVPGPDAETLATGDAGSRVACGVLAPASTTPAGTTETATVTETTAMVPPPPGPATTTEMPPAETTTPTETTAPTEPTTSPTTTTETMSETTPPTEGEGLPAE